MQEIEAPLVSVICLSYNHAPYVEEALDSIRLQEYNNIELIILDDCSTDNSVAVIEEWIETNQIGVFVKNSKNLGNTKSFNKALKLVKGDYIIDFSADDFLNKNFVKQHLCNFENSKYPRLGISFSNVELVNQIGEHKGFFHQVDRNLLAIEKPAEGDVYIAILESYFFCPIGLMVKKEVYDTLSGYDETLAFEDLDFWIRSSRTYQYSYLDKVLAKKREVNGSLSTNFMGSFLNVKPKQRIIEKSLFRICEKAFLVNRTIAEHEALIKRIKIYYGWVLKSLNISVLLKFGYLHIKVKFFVINGLSGKGQKINI